MQWETVKWREKGPRGSVRRPYLPGEIGFQQGSRRARPLPWLAMPYSPLALVSEPNRAGGCLKGARHCPQRNYFSKVRARDPSLKETAVGWREEGPLWGSGTSSFCWRMPLPSWAAASASAAQTLPGSLALHSHFYKNIFSWVNLVQLTFWCLISILIFKAFMVSAFTH